MSMVVHGNTGVIRFTEEFSVKFPGRKAVGKGSACRFEKRTPVLIYYIHQLIVWNDFVVFFAYDYLHRSWDIHYREAHL